MRNPWNRARRWARRTGWMARAVRADLGFSAGRAPAWLGDNPFWRRALSTDSRRFLLLGRLLLTLLLLSAVLIGGLWLGERYGRSITPFGRMFGINVPWAAWVLVAVSFIHVMCVFAARGAFSLSLGLEAERQTLPMLLLAPLRRAEMVWASAVPPAMAALIVAAAGLPLYLLLMAMGGADPGEIGALYLFFLLLAFEPPAYLLPALSPDPPPIMRTDKSARARRGSGSTLSYIPIMAWMTWSVSRLSPFIGGWGVHLFAALPPSVAQLGAIFFAWPLCGGLLLAAPLPFFGGHLPPLVYVAPLLLAGWVASALRTGASLSAGDVAEIIRQPIARRAAAISLWSGRLGRLCLLAFVWQPWVLSGDMGHLTGTTTPTLADNLAGLLLVLGSLAIPSAATAARKADWGAARRLVSRPALFTVRRVLQHAMRPLRYALLLFALACLCGGAWPFAPPVYHVLGRLALVALAAVVCAAGVSALRRRRDALSAVVDMNAVFATGLNGLFWLFGAPFAALALPAPFSLLAAFSPATAWVELYPGSAGAIHAFPYWPLGSLPPFPLAVAAPILLGLALASLAWRAPRSAAAAPVRPSKLTAAAPRHPVPTATVVSWAAAHADNPLFLRELRARTRDGRWADLFYKAPIFWVVAVAGTTFYPSLLGAFSAFSVLAFFRPHGLFSMTLPTLPEAYGALAALMFSMEFYILGFRGQTIGEALLLREQERGSLNHLLVTPLSAAQILGGKAWGQSLGSLLAWTLCGIAGLALYLLSASEYGLTPVLIAWAVSQGLALAAYGLSLAVGAACATVGLRFRVLRGLSTLLLMACYFVLVKLLLALMPGDWAFGKTLLPGTFAGLLARLVAVAFLLTIPLFLFARARIAALRRRDITFDTLTG